MIQNRPTVHELLEDAHQWEHDGDNFVAKRLGAFYAVLPFTVKHSELFKLHPDFPEAILGCIRHSKSAFGQEFAQGMLVKYTLAHLLGQSKTITSREGKRVTFSNIDVMYRPPDATLTVLSGSVLHIGRTENPGNSVEYVTSWDSDHIPVLCTDLDKEYPGWKVRHEVAESLELSMQELTKYVFSNEPTYNVETPLPEFK